jgi:leucyl-tRNA---protein transferase
MLCNLHSPAYISPSSLDTYLEKGWFRMGQSMFTTSFLNFNNTYYNALWLRLDLKEFKIRKSGKKILQLNQGFKTEIRKLSFSMEKNELFEKYRSHLPFNIARSLQALLLDEGNLNIFNTMEVCVYDEDKLVAMGVFDMGLKAGQGVINIIDPEYAKYSLGKLLMLNKIQYLIASGCDFYYPGYVAPGYPLFDYKTQISEGGIYFYNIINKSWQDYSTLDLSKCPLEIISEKLNKLSKNFLLKTLYLKILKYQFFDINLYKDYAHLNLFSEPYFISLKRQSATSEIIICYNILNQKYQVYLSQAVFEVSVARLPGVYNSSIIKTEELKYETNDIEKLVNYIAETEFQSIVN